MLPADRYLASLLGLTEEQYQYWKDYVEKQAKEGPQPSVVCGAETLAIVSLTLTIIGIGFQIIGALLQRPVKPAELEVRQRKASNQIGITSFAPRTGFDAVQDIGSIGAPIPVVYALRETIDGKTYGGVRVNLSLLWSQIWSLGGSQLLRSVFMLGEGSVSAVDPLGFAIGDNSIGSYDLLSESGNQIGGRLTIYYKQNGGRISSEDYIAGRLASADIGNAEISGGADVFSLRTIDNEWRNDFSSASKPSTSTTFGVYSAIGNNLGFKLNPIVRPGVVARLRPVGRDGDARVVCDKDQVVQVQRKKYEAFFSSRSGITSGSFGAVGDTVTYKLFPSSDLLTEFAEAGVTATDWVASVISDFSVFGRPDSAFGAVTTGGIFGGLITGSDYSTLVSAVSFGTPVVDITDKLVTVDTTFNIATIKNYYSGSSIGTYRVPYGIRIRSETRDTNVDLLVTAVVTVRDFNTYTRDGSTDAIDFTNETFFFGSTVNNTSSATQTDVILEFPSDSGPVTFLTSPERQELPLVFDYNDADAYTEAADDVASSVSARQRAWDDAIVVGELYKIGSALAVCTARLPNDEIFRSEADRELSESGQAIEAVFQVVRPGQASVVDEAILEAPGGEVVTRQTGTSGPHLMRVAIANVTTSRECRIVEVGIRSILGISISGLMRFRGGLSFAEADGRACLNKEGNRIRRGNTVKVDQYQSATVSTSEERYSFWRVSYREYSETSFTDIAQYFGVVSQTEQAVFNYLRLEFPYEGRWEIRIEPLSGWEIRNVLTVSDLHLLNARLSDYTEVVSETAERTVKASFNGKIIPRTGETFALLQTKRESMGLSFPDTDQNYADAWGKLAEAFIYEEIQSSASRGPEHEIVYVNEIIENETAPNYDEICLVGLNILSAFEWTQFRQFSAYVTGGATVRRLLQEMSEGPSHLFPDIALDRFTNLKYGPGRITDDLIGLESFALSSQWCYDRRYFYDGPVMLATDSPRQWCADVAATMLLDFREVGGRYYLYPAITFERVEHKALFTAGNIEENTFKAESVSTEDVRPIRVSARWREERRDLNPSNPGLFPVEQEVVVREADPIGSDGDPIESIDLTDYVTNEEHAIDVCKFKIRSARLRDHVISFRTTYDGLEGICAELAPGDYIKVAIDSVFYSNFNNGVVLNNGTIVSTIDLEPGSYDVISWAGDENAPADSILTVASRNKGAPTGIIFTVKETLTQVKTYQVTRITPTDEGKFDIEALFSPIDENGILEIVKNWDDPGSWVISPNLPS